MTTPPRADAPSSEEPRRRVPRALVPVSMRGYRKEWLLRDVLAGVTLAAVAIPEVMGYTSIAQTPIVTGLYTMLFPLLMFALLGASRLLVVGGDSATAAILASGLVAAGSTGAAPGSERWVALCSATALVCGVFLVVARLLRLGFIGDFLSASVLIGFLTGVGIQVATSQIPDILGVAKGSGNWVQDQWTWMTELGTVSWPTIAYGAVTVAIIVVFKRFVPKVPGAIIAVVGLLAVATVSNAPSYGVEVVGAVPGGFPPIGLPSGIAWADMPVIFSTAFACFIIIVAQSAATSRSFAMKHGRKADVNRDIVGLSASNLAAGLTGTFVVNGSPTKTQILDGQGGRTQVANLTVVVLTLVVLLFLTDLLTDLPKAVLGGVVFLIGIELIDVTGLRRVARVRRQEFVIALLTAVTVVVAGVGAGVILAIVLSLLDVVARQYRAPSYILRVGGKKGYKYKRITDGVQTEPGLIVFRFGADLFYANAARFVEDVQRAVAQAPDPVRWLVIDWSGISDIDYSAGQSMLELIDWADSHGIELVFARPDTEVLSALRAYGVHHRIPHSRIFSDLDTAVQAFPRRPSHDPEDG